MSLHPILQAKVDAAAGLPPMTSVPIATIRAGDATRYRTGLPDDAVAGTEDRLIPGPRGDMRIRIYTPQVDHTPATGLPVTLFFHGSGFVICSIESHDTMCRQICRRSASIVVSLDYALAPENKFPAAPDDCLAAARWVGQHAATFGGDATRLALAGDSAGANLATVTALRLRDEGGPALRAQLLIYPVADHYSAHWPSYEECAVGYGLGREGMEWFWNHYLHQPEDGAHAHASPLRAASLAGLAPAYVITGQYDPLRDEGEDYAATLRKAGVDTQVRRYDGMNHGFLFWVNVIDVSTQAMDAACAWLKGKL